jgi:hypothetical protein
MPNELSTFRLFGRYEHAEEEMPSMLEAVPTHDDIIMAVNDQTNIPNLNCSGLSASSGGNAGRGVGEVAERL